MGGHLTVGGPIPVFWFECDIVAFGCVYFGLSQHLLVLQIVRDRCYFQLLKVTNTMNGRVYLRNLKVFLLSVEIPWVKVVHKRMVVI